MIFFFFRSFIIPMSVIILKAVQNCKSLTIPVDLPLKFHSNSREFSEKGNDTCDRQTGCKRSDHWLYSWKNKIILISKRPLQLHNAAFRLCIPHLPWWTVFTDGLTSLAGNITIRVMYVGVVTIRNSRTHIS